MSNMFYRLYLSQLNPQDSPRPVCDGADPFNYTAPKHAFPAIYPTIPESDHVKDGRGSFARPDWRHVPAVSAESKTMPDLDDVIVQFARLRINPGSEELKYKRKRLPPCMRETGAKPARSSPPFVKPDCAAAIVAITTVAPKAPLEAFIPEKLVPSILMRLKSPKCPPAYMASSPTSAPHESLYQSSQQQPSALSSGCEMTGTTRYAFTGEPTPFSYTQLVPLFNSTVSAELQPSSMSSVADHRSATLFRRTQFSPKSHTLGLDIPSQPPPFGSPLISPSVVAPNKHPRVDIPHRSPLAETLTSHSRRSSSSSLYSSEDANGSSDSLPKTPSTPSPNLGTDPLPSVLNHEPDLGELFRAPASDAGHLVGDVYNAIHSVSLDLLSSIAARTPKMPVSHSSSVDPALLTIPIAPLS
jgi:hypothetical protein